MPRSIHALERQGPSDIPYIPPYSKDDIIYPESDGKPMADNTEQFNWIVKIKEGLEAMFADRPDVFVAGDLLWYPVKKKTRKEKDKSAAPDAMVVFGRPKGRRGSYLQWKEDNIAPQVVFEILSPSNTKSEMKEKLKFYREHGVEEYYLYDPDKITFDGWSHTNGRLLKIRKIQGWKSPRLGIRFELTDEELIIYRPDGRRFLSYVEIEKRAEEAEAKARMLTAKLKELGVSVDDL
ncbi:Uma2 family endonuclease [Desulfobacterales bacterium HSG17]|nr:Uma2 family endonuclease [Desulfobacterales bacterium HSG17]